MAVQFNLLPDVKLEFAKQQSAKRLIFTVSSLACGIAVLLLVIGFLFVNVAQKKLLNDAGNDINTYTKKISSIPELSKVINIQNQLGALPTLHEQKHFMSRLFNYIPQLTPNSVSIGKLGIDNTANTIEISGTADSIKTVNIFVDTFKFTTFKYNNINEKDCKSNQGNWDSDHNTCTKSAFTDVVLSAVNRDDKGADYTINATFDPALFVGEKGITLIVPQETTTRSVLNAPDPNNPIFNGKTGTSSGQGSQ